MTLVYNFFVFLFNQSINKLPFFYYHSNLCKKISNHARRYIGCCVAGSNSIGKVQTATSVIEDMMKFIRKYRRDQSIIVASLLFIQLQYISLNCNIFSNVLAANVESTTTTAGATDFLAATWDTMSLTIEELWLRETKNAEEEIERQMLGLTEGNSMSMIIPTPAPAAAPSPIATTLVPVDDTPTIGPTPENCLNGRTSEQYLLDTLAAITTSLDVLLNPATPQGQAFNFLLNDTLIDDDDAICNYTTLQQRYGLGTLLHKSQRCSPVYCLSVTKLNHHFPFSFSVRAQMYSHVLLCDRRLIMGKQYQLGTIIHTRMYMVWCLL